MVKAGVVWRLVGRHEFRHPGRRKQKTKKKKKKGKCQSLAGVTQRPRPVCRDFKSLMHRAITRANYYPGQKRCNGDCDGSSDSERSGLVTMGQHWVLCEARHSQLLHSSLLFLFRAARVTTAQWFDKKSGAYHTSFNHEQSTKRPSQTQKCM